MFRYVHSWTKYAESEEQDDFEEVDAGMEPEDTVTVEQAAGIIQSFYWNIADWEYDGEHLIFFRENMVGSDDYGRTDDGSIVLLYVENGHTFVAEGMNDIHLLRYHLLKNEAFMKFLDDFVEDLTPG